MPCLAAVVDTYQHMPCLAAVVDTYQHTFFLNFEGGEGVGVGMWSVYWENAKQLVPS